MCTRVGTSSPERLELFQLILRLQLYVRQTIPGWAKSLGEHRDLALSRLLGRRFDLELVRRRQLLPAWFHRPDVAGVIGDGSVARELARRRYVEDGHLRPF